ncbi:hypothetical protein LB504_005040 [Fusarium proliferatum]|nr:hypothetical protein LB504_005040 [Fusarium proliferatum]
MESSRNPHLDIHYSTPATRWDEALPIGNGRLGAVVYGGTDIELLQLNEDSVWYGGPQDRTPPDAQRMLSRLRQLIRDERHSETEVLVTEAFFATPSSMRHYEPLGTATLEFNHKNVTGYKRALHLNDSEVSVEFSADGGFFNRHVIASYPDDAIILRTQGAKRARFVARLDRLNANETETNSYVDTVRSFDSQIVLHATPGGINSNRLCSVLGVECDDDGTVEAIGNCLVVNSSSCRIAIAAQTTFRHEQPEKVASDQVSQALSRTWDDVVERHRTDYHKLFNRMSLKMQPDACHLPTNERLLNNRDPGLVALYHNYGRYLLISSSRNGHKPLPATLQGIWNPSFAPPWGSKFTININTQMNYWPAGPCSLSYDCTLPLVDLVERLSIRGSHTARAMYNCRGWCAHHNTDIWADTSPQDRWVPATLWPLGGLWLSITLMEGLRYDYEKELHERLFRIHEGAVQFVLDFMIPSKCGSFLITNPSISPENTFISNDGSKGVFCEGSTMDMTLIRQALEQFHWSLERLSKTDHPLEQPSKDALLRLPPLAINEKGLIQEWGINDYEEDEPGHRHVSHLYGLHPGEFIHPMHTPDLAIAAKKVLERRLANGGGHTGWSRAWLLNFLARLRDSEACRDNMDLLLSNSTLPNLLDSHPPFQIDGNFGACAGIIECLVQSVETEIDGLHVVCVALLPACPDQWETGHLQRVRVKQGWLISFQWVSKRHLVGAVEVFCTMGGADDVHIRGPDQFEQRVKGKGGRRYIFEI